VGEVRVDAEELTRWVEAVLGAVGAGDDQADACARVLVAADLCGHGSHGVSRLPAYVRQLVGGHVDGHADPEVVAAAGATATIDAHNGLGHLAGERAARLAAELCREHGMGLVVVRGSNHYGIAGHYVRLVLAEGLLGWSATNSGASVAPTGAARPFLGTNPLAFGAPALDGHDLLLDMATSAVSGGKFEVASREGRSVPTGWGVTAAGEHTTDPDAVFGAGGWLLPLGSTPELSSHKGFGLGLVVEVLTAVLAGGPVGPDVGNLTYAAPDGPAGVSHVVGALSPDGFGGLEAIEARVSALEDAVVGLPAVDRDRPVRMPGSRARRDRDAASRHGVPLPGPVLDQLRHLAETHGQPMPRARP
jgi:LDH2 family malate/lactate/ureidoglycolate dehydrogenase